MYSDAGYGENWQPEANNARRLNPYTRTYIAFGSLFAIGFLLIVIIVLSLIPLYISRNASSTSTTNNKVQVSKIAINDFKLGFQLPNNNFNPDDILKKENNRQTIQASLTSMIQNDSILNGSIAEIDKSSMKNRLNKQTNEISNEISFNLNIISSRSCTSVTCLSQFETHTKSVLSKENNKTSIVRCEQTDSTDVYWLSYSLPKTIKTNASFVYVEVDKISTILNTLIEIDKTENQPSNENSTTTTTTTTISTATYWK